MLFRDQFKSYKDFISQFLKNSATTFGDLPWIPVLFTIGIVLRVAGIRTASLWHDELFSLQMTRQGLLEMIQSLKMNISPPGWEIVLWFITRILGWNEVSARVLSILAGIAILVVVYRISLVLRFTRAQQIASLALIALLPYQILTAQQGRVYAVFALLYLMGIYGIISQQWIWLGASVSGMLWSHNISFLYIPSLILISLSVNHRSWRSLLVTIALALATYLPWAQTTIQQAGYPTPWFTPITVVSFFIQLFEAFFAWGFPEGTSYARIAFYWLICLLGIALLVSVIVVAARLLQALRQLAGGFFKKNPSIQRDLVAVPNILQYPPYAQRTLLLAFGIPFLFLLVTSLLMRNVFISRTIYPLTIPLAMWLVHFYGKPHTNRVHTFIWITSTMVIAASLPYWMPSQIGRSSILDLKEVVSGTYSTPLRGPLREGVAFYHNTGLSAQIFGYYFPTNTNYLIDGDNVIGSLDLNVARVEIPRIAPQQLPRQKIWVIWTRSLDLEIINKTADQRFRVLIDKYDCPLVMVMPYPNSWDLYVYLCDLGDK